ncbi:MAG: ABC transporter ATP-binding protein [Pseudomonadota bacterium]
MTPLLHLTDIHKSYRSGADTTPILRGVSLRLDAGMALALTGESGSGKSTLMHLAAALDTPDTGSILLNGIDIAPLSDTDRAALRRSQIGLVFQQFNLIPSLTVAQNIGFQARLAGRHDPEVVRHLTDRLGLTDHEAKFPEQLSGGQQQRVAIARALAARPALILADEPTGNLDEDTSETVMDLLLDLVRETGAGLLMVTHSTRLATRADRHLHLSHGRVAPLKSAA